MIGPHLEALGLGIRPEETIPVANATRALDVALATLLRPGERVLVPALTDPALLALLRIRGLYPVALPVTPQGGPDVPAWLQRLRARTAAVAVVPSSHAPPAGTVIAGHERRLLVEAVALLRPMLRPMLLGVGIGALLYAVVPQGWLAEVLGTTAWWSLPLAALLGLPLYLRGEAAFPIGAGLLAAGVGAGPMFAMVIAGMGASVPEVTILSGIFHRRLLAAFLASVFAVAIVGGLVIPAAT